MQRITVVMFVAIVTLVLTCGQVAFSAQPHSAGPCAVAELTFFKAPQAKVVDGVRTVVTFWILNEGKRLAKNLEVSIEDAEGSGPNRIATTRVESLGPGKSQRIELFLPYPISREARRNKIVLMIDPKNEIEECNEDNNRRTVGG